MPKLDYGFVAFSTDELVLMREHGICIYCDLKEKCQILGDILTAMTKQKAVGKDLRATISLCSECKVLGKRTYGVRGD